MKSKSKKIEHYKLENPNIKYVWLGDLASIIVIVSSLPLVIDVLKNRKTQNFPYYWLILILISASLALTYGLINRLQPTVISSSVMFITYLTLLIFKIIFERKNEF